MSGRVTAPARLPPPGLPGLDPAWSRLFTVEHADGPRTWHVLDNGAEPEHGTLLCVHGNPTWSYLWRRVLAAAPRGWRVIAPDHLGMGFSERPAAARDLAQRITDLEQLTAELGVSGRVVTLAHDWGGPISLGWALAHRPQLAGVVLANTGVHQPEGSPVPALIRLARTSALREAVCVRSPVFVRGATAVSRPRPPRAVRDAYAAPYASPDRRAAVGDFVADIPLEPDHPSAPALAAVRDGLPALRDVPVLMLWGPRDPVFGDRYLRDLLTRLPQAGVQRYEGASHLVPEDAASLPGDVAGWLRAMDDRREPDVRARPPIGSAGVAPRSGTAIVELGRGGRTVGFAELAKRVEQLAAGLRAHGVRAGDRVALLVPPGADLVGVLYACWRAGAVVVLADAGLGARGLGRALRGAGPDHVVAAGRGLAAARLLRVPGRRIAVRDLDELARVGRSAPAPAVPDADDECAVIFTSGATGPAKGVVYRHRHLQAQLAALTATYAITPEDRLVAAFAPFALYGPALGIASAVPDVDVTRPAGLTAHALAEAVSAVAGTLVFASPAALRNVVDTAAGLTDADRAALAGVRLVLSAGAPVPVALLREVAALVPAAEVRTPYGMTEALPVADVSLTELDGLAGSDEAGVCVGRPVAGVEVAVAPLDGEGVPSAGLDATTPGPTGEVCVRAAHVKDRYDRLWALERATRQPAGWHRTGDVGHLDADGRLWVEGRLPHVVVTAGGVVTPVGPEQRVGALDEVRAAAVVGVGPRGTQQVVVVVLQASAGAQQRAGPLADAALREAVRAVAGVEVAAVLVATELPVDIRHQSKVDRRRVAEWAERILAGRRAGRAP